MSKEVVIHVIHLLSHNNHNIAEGAAEADGARSERAPDDADARDHDGN